jgi:hypothetical protein
MRRLMNRVVIDDQDCTHDGNAERNAEDRHEGD